MMVTLISIVHDPTGVLLKPTKQALGLLREIYDNVAVVVTDTSHRSLIEALGHNVVIAPQQGVGPARRLALRYGLSLDDTHFHYCDFDRVLFWVLYYPEEMKKISQKITKYPFTVIGRTEAAFNSHPEFQRRTEREGNIQFSMAWGPGAHLDILAGSRGISGAVGHKILANSVEMGAAGIDAEWPIITGPFWYTEVDGLAYESGCLGIEKDPADEAILRAENLMEVLEVIRKRS